MHRRIDCGVQLNPCWICAPFDIWSVPQRCCIHIREIRIIDGSVVAIAVDTRYIFKGFDFHPFGETRKFPAFDGTCSEEIYHDWYADPWVRRLLKQRLDVHFNFGWPSSGRSRKRIQNTFGKKIGILVLVYIYSRDEENYRKERKIILSLLRYIKSFVGKMENGELNLLIKSVVSAMSREYSPSMRDENWREREGERK